MTLYIVRHGLTEENQQQILQGHLPGVLTEEGKKQMELAAERLLGRGVKYDRIICSDLKRAVDSAKIIGRKLGMNVVPCEMLRERDWGSYTGIKVSEAKEKYYVDGKWKFPITENPVESEEQLKERAGKLLKQMKERHSEENVILVTHGLFARFIIGAKCNCDYKEVTPLVNAEVRVVET